MNKFYTVAVALIAGNSAFAGSSDYVAPTAPKINPAPVSAPVGDWSGLYAGLQAGMLTGHIEATGAEAELDGTVYGAHVGYNFDFGRFVLGGEFDYNTGSGEGVTNARAADLDYSIMHLKARAGYDLGSVLAYATTGAAVFEYESVNYSPDGMGYFVGLGGEYRISNDWSVGAEYLVYQFSGFGDEALDADVDLQTLTARVSYHF